MNRRWFSATLGAAAFLGFAWSRRTRFDLNGKVVLITGGSRGLGLALARGLYREGASLALCARSPSELEAARGEFPDASRVVVVTCDVSNRHEVDEFVRVALSRFGRIDVLINNASVIEVGPDSTMEEMDFREVMEVNFWGTLNVTLAALPYLKGVRGSGVRKAIVNITSIGGVVSVPHLLPYSCAKFAAVGLSEGLHTELGGEGVHVMTVIPGLMRTGSFLHAQFKGERRREFSWFSVSSSAPFLTMNATRAADRIIRGIQRLEPHLVLGMPAKALRLFQSLLPSACLRALRLANRFLPVSEARNQEPEPGYLQRSARSPLTVLGDRAAREYRENRSF